MAKPKKGSDKPLYYYKGENGKLIPIKDSIKWTDLSAKDKKKVAKTVVKGTTSAATRGALMAIPSPKKIKAGVKAIDEARKLKNAKVFLNDLKKNGVAVSKPSSPFIGITNSASARSERARAIRSGKVVDINKKRQGK